MAHPLGQPDPPPTPIERWIADHLHPEPRHSAQALYDLMPLQRGGQLPLVDLPYDPRREDHWADAARIADYAAHAPDGPRQGEGGATTALDIGPGDGWPALPLAHARPDLLVVGLDPSPRRTEVCRANARRLALPNTEFVTGDGTAMPFADAAFHLATAASSLEESQQPDALLAEVRRVLRPGGLLRASYQDWRLAAPEVETVQLWQGRVPGGTADGPVGGTDVLLYSYARRIQTPAIERRHTLLLPADDEQVAALHHEALIATAEAPRAYGEALLTPALADRLGIPLLERLAPHVLRATSLQLRRWTTEQLADLLREGGWSEVRATVHPGELGRRFARDLIARDRLTPFAPLFEDATTALGRIAATQPGNAMITAIR